MNNQPATSLFLKKVRQLIKKGYMQGDAYTEVVTENPELHKAMNREQNDSDLDSEPELNDSSEQKTAIKEFWSTVKQFVKSGMTRTDAIEKVVCEFPEVHQAYIDAQKD